MAEFWLETERLILRDWQDSDSEPFADMCADPDVMATLGPVMTQEESDALIERIKDRQHQYGHTFWAIENRSDGGFIGWCGIIRGSVGPIIDKAEIGWRIAHRYWGQGYAREAAQASLDWGFTHLADAKAPNDRIWAITSSGNNRSWGLMERLGMTRHHDLDFMHPNVAPDSNLNPHITYSIGKYTWQLPPQ